jgi:hypothetical protein
VKKEFGPNQAAVDAFLERLEMVDDGQALLLASLAGDDPERRRAREAMVAAARHSARERELGAAQDEVERWMNVWFSGGPQLAGYGRDISSAEAAAGAAPAVLDAIGALVVKDLLQPDDLETLIGPWNEVWQTRD